MLGGGGGAGPMRGGLPADFPPTISRFSRPADLDEI